MTTNSLPFKISTLVFIHGKNEKLLLIKRAKHPNCGCWSPIGGKLDMPLGESPYECARRETQEEVGLTLGDDDLHCFGYVSEKNYEGGVHWLMFLFNCLKPIDQLPIAIDEGDFGFFTRAEIDDLALPPSDKTLIWPYFDKFANGGFVGLRADCAPGTALKPVEELALRPTL